MLMRQLSPGKISMLYVSSEMFCTSGTGVGSGVASMTCGRGVGVTFGVGFGVVLGSSAVFWLPACEPDGRLSVEKPEVLPVFDDSAGAEVGVDVGVGAEVGVGDGVGDGVGVGTSSRKTIVTGSADGSLEEVSCPSFLNRADTGERPVRLTSTTCHTIPPATNTISSVPITASFFLFCICSSFLLNLQVAPPGLRPVFLH